MKKTVLAFNFSSERLRAVKLLCMMLKALCRPVQRGEMLQPLGYLAGVGGFAPVSEEYSGSEDLPEALLLCGFERRELDRLLAAITKSSLRKVALKAVLTPHNAAWNGVQLLEELGKEHSWMQDKGRTAPPLHSVEQA